MTTKTRITAYNCISYVRDTKSFHESEENDAMRLFFQIQSLIKKGISLNKINIRNLAREVETKLDLAEKAVRVYPKEE